MLINSYRWSISTKWNINLSPTGQIDLVLVFADNQFFTTPECYTELKNFFPSAQIVGCSSSGNIQGLKISDGDMIALAISFSSSKVVVKSQIIESKLEIGSLVKNITQELISKDLKQLMVFSDGLLIDGSELTHALNAFGVPVTGGLAGDANRFKESWVMANGPAKQNQIALIGFYGNISISRGFATGWKEFGPERRITRSQGNTVFEINHQPALEVYTRYLGEFSVDLPASGLRFPFSVRRSESDEPYIRTLLGINQKEMSLTFAGSMPQGSLCKLMKSDIDSLIEASGKLAKELACASKAKSSLCIAISCVGRRLVMGQVSEGEIELIQENLGNQATIFGFYSYGEVVPFDSLSCALLNQTTTLTIISEAD